MYGGLAWLAYLILEELPAKETDRENLLIALSALNLAGILTALGRYDREAGTLGQVVETGAVRKTGAGSVSRAADHMPALPGRPADRVPGPFPGKGKAEIKKQASGGKDSGAGKLPARTGYGRAGPRVIKWAAWNEGTK